MFDYFSTMETNLFDSIYCIMYLNLKSARWITGPKATIICKGNYVEYKIDIWLLNLAVRFVFGPSQQQRTFYQSYTTWLISYLNLFQSADEIMPYALSDSGWLTWDVPGHASVLKLAFDCGREPLLNWCLTVIEIDRRGGRKGRDVRQRERPIGYRRGGGCVWEMELF